MLLTTIVFFTVLTSPIEDWPQYNGSDHSRSSQEEVEVREWPDGGPREVWRKSTPLGFSSFAVAEGAALTLIGRGGSEVCVALDAATGTQRWATSLSAAKYDGGGGRGTEDNSGGDGPRSTPSVVDGRVYIFDAATKLWCLKLETGEVEWSHDLLADFDGRSLRWQNSASPLVEGDNVYVFGGGECQSLIAFDRKSGKVVWKAHDEQPTHATPVAATIHGQRQIIFLTQSGLLSVHPDHGKELWSAEYPYRVSTAASPVIHEDVVYCSAGYGVGGGAFRVHRAKGNKLEAELLWQKRNALINHWSTPVCIDGYLYGMFSFKEYGEGALKCVSLETGEIQWEEEGFGPGNVIRVGDDIIALSDKGDVVLIEPIPDAYEEVARADLLEGKCWSTPVFSDGRLFVRSTKEGGCFDLTGNAAQ